MSDKLKKASYVLMILTGLTAAILVVFLLGRTNSRIRKESVPYSGTLLRYDGWVVLRKDNSVQRVRLPAYVAPEGDTLKAVNTLPRALESGTCLAFESTNVTVTVKIDGDEIYSNAETVGAKPFSMWNFVLLDAIQAEGRITIEFTSRDRYDAGILPEIFLGPRSEILLLAERET